MVFTDAAEEGRDNKASFGEPCSERSKYPK